MWTLLSQKLFQSCTWAGQFVSTPEAYMTTLGSERAPSKHVGIITYSMACVSIRSSWAMISSSLPWGAGAMSEPGWGEDGTTLSIKKKLLDKSPDRMCFGVYIYTTGRNAWAHPAADRGGEKAWSTWQLGSYTALSGGAAFRRGTEGTSHQNDVTEPSNSQVQLSFSQSGAWDTSPKFFQAPILWVWALRPS